MFKIENCLNLFCSMPLVLPTALAPIKMGGLTCSDIGPFSVGDDDVTITFSYMSLFDYSYAYEYMSLALHGGEIFYSERKPVHEIRSNSMLNFSFTLFLACTKRL